MLTACKQAVPSITPQTNWAFTTDRAEWADYADIELNQLETIVADSEGNTYSIASDKSIAVTAADGAATASIYPGEYLPLSLTNTAGGRIFLIALSLKMETVLFEIGNMRLSLPFSAPVNAIKAYSGGDICDILLDTGAEMYAYSLGGQTQKLFSWASVGISGESVLGIVVLDTAHMLINSNGDLYRLSRASTDGGAEKIRLTLACFGYNSDIAARVAAFNSENAQYEIVPTYYSDGYDASSYDNKAMLKFNAQITSGEIPDIIVMYSVFPIENYIKKGVLADLYLFLDADTELGGRDAIHPDVRRISEYDGKLYQVSSSFTLNVVVGTSASLRGNDSWTYAEAAELLSQTQDNSVIMSNVTAFYALDTVLYTFIDYESASCDFDSLEFVEALNYAKTFPDEFPVTLDLYKAVFDGTALAANNPLFWDFRAHIAARTQLGNEITYIGFPGRAPDGSMNYIEFSMGASISAASKHKDEAWEFVRAFIEEDGSTKFAGFPTNMTAFERMAALAMERTTDGDGKASAAVQSDIDAVKAVISRAAKRTTDFSLNAIVSEEASAFFAGAKSAEEVAALIQSRVGIYLSEQYG
jgi:ABC-type glycerol-3-phosphate transport system substrate-binding protein